MRTLSMAPTHPIRELLPHCFSGAEEKEQADPTRLTPWYQNTQTAYPTRLDKILSMVNEWIQPQTLFEKIDTFNTALRAENTIHVRIDNGTKEEVAEKHQRKFADTNLTTNQVYFYIGWSQLEGKTGEGIAAYHRGEMVAEETSRLGEEMEFFDAELYTFEKATSLAAKYTTTYRKIRQV